MITCPTWTDDPLTVRPMLASVAQEDQVRFDDPACMFERKYDGIRCLASAVPPGATNLSSRNGLPKSAQFPQIAKAVGALAAAIGPILLDGEIIALDDAGQPASFTLLQEALPGPGGRKTKSGRDLPKPPLKQSCFVVFDVLRYAQSDLRALPLRVRRSFLEEIVGKLPARYAPDIVLSVVGEGTTLWQSAQQQRWEGLIIKNADSKYASNARNADWRKLKLTQEMTFVVGGYSGRAGDFGSVGSLVLGVPEADGKLRHVGSVGSGFNDATIAQLASRLAKLTTTRCPFGTPPQTLKPAVWVQPALQVDVRFSEWTPAGSLRHPVFLAWRESTLPADLVTQTSIRQQALAPASHPTEMQTLTEAQLQLRDQCNSALLDIEVRNAEGRIKLGPNQILKVSNLAKVFWPSGGYTKGDLLRHYVNVNHVILPVVADRALVMKRHPNGVNGEAFYQHRAPEPTPAGARAEQIPGDDVPARLVGGNLFTLLYMAQLGVISQDPWFSKIGSTEFAHDVAFDLDPMPGVDFERVRDVALWLHEALLDLGVAHFAKTSGATGLHIFVPLAPNTPYETARLFTQIVATLVSNKHPKVATVERSVSARGNTVYIDYLQNIEGKTLACAYSARASDFAGVSTPLTWQEVQDGAVPQDFTIKTIVNRLASVGDLWEGTRHESNQLAIADALAALSSRGKRR